MSPEDFRIAQNNFHLFFTKDNGEKISIGRIYRKKEVFQQCLRDNPKQLEALVKELSDYRFQRWYVDKDTNKMDILPDDPRSQEMHRKLYNAYLLMREYVEDDRTLFK